MKIRLVAKKEDETPEHLEKVLGFFKGFAKSVRDMQKTSEGLWGWCRVEVIVTFKVGDKTFQGVAHLGACSYASETDFVLNSMYFADMVAEAIENAKPVSMAIQS